ncbi:hypothetical protein ACFH04_21175 [Streptomyces noboritoensis]|uniref:SnoaL-like domain-containing protein n=1 Tax=Streptomyces noboritoensis TaxID=67337 RepID=A0ABV6TLE6_9ACTN
MDVTEQSELALYEKAFAALSSAASYGDAAEECRWGGGGALGSVQGGTVSVDIDARQRDGSNRAFTGTYTVRNGEITSASVRRTG